MEGVVLLLFDWVNRTWRAPSCLIAGDIGCYIG